MSKEAPSQEPDIPIPNQGSDAGDAVPISRHPWDDPENPWIERSEPGWRQKGTERRRSSFYWDKAIGRSHPVLYKLFGYSYYRDSVLRLTAGALGEDFANGWIVSDEQLSHLSDPPRWPRSITRMWPQLATRRRPSG
jgi:hypothetical protein